MRSVYKPRFKLDSGTKEIILKDLVEYEQSWKQKHKKKIHIHRLFHLTFQTAIVVALVFLFIKTPLLDKVTNKKETTATSEIKSDSVEMLTIAPRMVIKNEVHIREIEGENSYEVIATGGALEDDPSQGVLKITKLNYGLGPTTDYFQTNVKHGALSIEAMNSGILVVAEDGMKWEVKFSANNGTFREEFFRRDVKK